MAKDEKFKKNPAVRSMLTIALYLILLIGMWSVIAKWAFPTTTDLSRAKALLKQYPALIAQLAENSADSSQWEGVSESETVQELYENNNITYVETDNGLTRFYMKSDDVTTTHALVYAPDGEYVPPTQASEWTEAQSESEIRYTSDRATATATRLGDVFFYEEVVTSN